MSDRFPEKPKTIIVKKHYNQITIIKKWLNCSTFLESSFTFLLFLLVFALFLISLMNDLILVAIFLLLIGISLIYYTIAMWINRTYIFADDQGITVFHKPIPWLGLSDRAFKLEKLERLYSKSFPSNTNKSALMDRNPPSYYEIRIQTHHGTDKQLLKINNVTLINTDNKNEALFIEKTLKFYLNLEDKPRKGELGNEW